jgi:predicted transcriptional regulator
MLLNSREAFLKLGGRIIRQSPRSRDGIVATILEVCSECPKLLSHVAGEARLNHKMARDYLDNLVEQGSVEKVEGFYITTEEGLRRLRSYEEFREGGPQNK